MVADGRGGAWFAGLLQQLEASAAPPCQKPAGWGGEGEGLGI